MTSKPSSLQLNNFPSFAAAPAVPPSPRKLRKFQSHQTLTSGSSLAFFAQQHSTSGQSGTAVRVRDSAAPYEQSQNQKQNAPSESSSARALPVRSRARSNSDAGSRTKTSDLAPSTIAATTTAARPRRPPRKTGSSGFAIKRSNLDNLLREGPADGKLLEALQELRLLVLSSRVEADGDGMSTYRIYLWLALLDIPPLPTDDYLSLVHRGRSPAYTKIRNDTFRTLATDPLFKRRVTEASLIRLLNAVAWKLHDAQNSRKETSRPSSRRRELELAIDNPPTIEEEPSILETAETVKTTIVTDGSGPYEEAVGGGGSKSAIYVQGMNVLCAPFLYAARSEVEAFALFHYFITKECPGYIRGAMDGVHRGLQLVDRCLEIVDSKLASHLFSRGMYAELYAFPSVMTLCACTPPLPQVLHLWDFLFAYGPHLNILCIVAQLNGMRDTILQSESPNKVLRSFPPLDAEKIITLTVSFVRKIPDDLYAELVNHAK